MSTIAIIGSPEGATLAIVSLSPFANCTRKGLRDVFEKEIHGNSMFLRDDFYILIHHPDETLIYLLVNKFSDFFM